MDLVTLYAAYAGAFEFAIVDDDWTRIEPFFTDDIIVVCHSEPFVAEAKGLDNVIDYFRDSVEKFDRRFDERVVSFPGKPVRDGDQVLMHWAAVFQIAGAPDLALDGTELAQFEGNRICRIDDRISPAASQRAIDWMQRHEDALRPIVTDFANALLEAAKSHFH